MSVRHRSSLESRDLVVLRSIVIVTLLALVGIWACSSGPSAPDDSLYLKALADARAEKDRFFAEDAGSPIPATKRAELLPLRYFPPDPAYSVPAVLRLQEKRDVFEIPTSTGQLRKMQRVGVLEFTLDGLPLSLGAFVEDGTTRISELFVPFADKTTGTDTYPAGRYLDLRPTTTGYYTVDFNQAYNPYCAYNDTYDCPYPPQSNRLEVAVRAGEKKPGA